MDNNIIGIKQLHRELSRVAELARLGQSFLVIKNSRPAFRIEPVDSAPIKKYSLANLKTLQFSAKDKNLSKKMDRIIY